MTIPGQHPQRYCAHTLNGPSKLHAEWMMASLVLLAIAVSFVSSMAGFTDAEGKEKNGVRRAASQLERKVVRVPIVRAGQVQIG